MNDLENLKYIIGSAQLRDLQCEDVPTMINLIPGGPLPQASDIHRKLHPYACVVAFCLLPKQPDTYDSILYGETCRIKDEMCRVFVCVINASVKPQFWLLHNTFFFTTNSNDCLIPYPSHRVPNPFHDSVTILTTMPTNSVYVNRNLRI